MRLIQLSDCHLFSDIHRTGYASVNPYSSLSKLLSLTASLQPDVVLVTGDISGDDTEISYQHFRTLTQDALKDIPLLVLAGNHDCNPYFDSMLSEYSLNEGCMLPGGQWVLHGLDTRHEGTLGMVKVDQLKLLSASIASKPETNHIVALHHHPLAANSWMDKHALLNAERLISFIKTTANVKLVLHGHLHFPLHRDINGTPVLGVPSTCWQWQMTDEFAFSTEQPGLRIVDLHDDGSWTTQIRRV
ncbi:metallophosphoesterase [Alteromonas ponticola]|uniref:3',5'-cyclic-nucleotide phosphodiesterase n=1 Tax=Alteromonas ponticola TaxID=2720613 RepID=A0ABX1R1M9_9ALTE|nr:metallophosphoesterase [Alteromonas ponticola]NMH60364.1 3',5'-cyclic-nucleotide phosphodiesterase [Alteromonas ponticola]